MKHSNTSQSKLPRVRQFIRTLQQIARPKYRAHIAETTMGGGGRKLQPIADVLARTGREPRAPD